MSIPKIDPIKFFKAINSGDFYTVDLALQGDLKPETTDKDGWTAAGRAVQKNRSGVLKVMFDHGLDAKLSGSGGVTLLHVAALANRPLMCQMLLREGGDPMAKNLAGMTPIDIAQSPEVKSMLQNAATEGLPPPLPDTEFEESEQVYCLDKNGMWWPAVIYTKKPGGWYEVHFPGYGRREDVTVKSESLLKISLNSMRQLESERRRLEAEAAAKKPNRSAKRRPNRDDDDKDDEDEEEIGEDELPQARTKGNRKRRKQSTQLKVGPSRLLDNYDDIIHRLQEQRELVADFGVRNGDADAKLQAQGVELARLKSQLGDATAAIEAQRKELNKKDKEVKTLQAEIVRQKKQSTPDLTGSLPASITGYAKKGDVSQDSLRKIAMLTARVQQLEAESARYQRLLKQYRPNEQQVSQLTNMRRPGQEDDDDEEDRQQRAVEDGEVNQQQREQQVEHMESRGDADSASVEQAEPESNDDAAEHGMNGQTSATNGAQAMATDEDGTTHQHQQQLQA